MERKHFTVSSSPRVSIFQQTNGRSQHRWKFDRTLTFSPLLGHDIGEYTCSIAVTGFDRIGNSENVVVMANGMNVLCTSMIVCTYRNHEVHSLLYIDSIIIYTYTLYSSHIVLILYAKVSHLRSKKP